MKSIVRILSIAFVAALTLSACNKDKVDYTDKGNDPQSNIGYLQLGGMEASVLEDTENVSSSPASTRAEGVDINTFDVVITNTAGEQMASFKYGERRITNFEMEGSALAGLAALMGHRAATICTIIAQRVAKDACTDYKPFVRKMIEMALNKLATL